MTIRCVYILLSLIHTEEIAEPGSFWYYAPNKGAPIAFAILFAISGVLHAYQCFKYRCWRVSGFLPWSALLFVIGFVLRAIAAFGLWDNLPIFISSTVLLLAAAPVYETANFFILGRILFYVPYHSPIHPGRVVTTFLALGAIVEVLSASGAARVANSKATQVERNVGEILLKISLILQIFNMCGFIAIAATFNRNVIRANLLTKKLRTVLTVLYCSCVLITCRTIYRTVEYFSSTNITFIRGTITSISPLLTTEAYFWCFEVIFMFLNTSMLNIFHPAMYLPKSNKIYLLPDGTETEGPGYKEDRSFLATLFDPFDIAGLIEGRDRKNRFWEMQERQRQESATV